MAYKTTKKDFEVFKSECRKWVKYFGLLDWEITYSNVEDAGSRGSCTVGYTGRLATINLATEWDYKPDESEMNLTAFHEVCELLTAPLCVIAESRYVTVSQVEIANHYIIRVLENTLFKEVT
jgi:hypothetical protein